MSKILVIDDDVEIRLFLLNLLQAKGHIVISAENGDVGIKLAAQELPDLILMDLNMPVMDGFKATQAIKANSETANISVLILSAEHAEANREAMYEAGCDGFIAKPIEIGRLFARLSEFIND